MAFVRVDYYKCKGHALCIKVCPVDVFELDEDKKSTAPRMADCIECCSCVVSCPEESIWVDVCE